MHKIKIMRIIARLNIGGPARHVIWLTSRAGPDFEPILVSGHVEANEEEMTAFCRAEGVTPLYLSGLGRSIGLKDLAVFLKILRLIHLHNPDIIDTHTAKAGMLGRSAALVLNLVRAKRIRTVHTFHGHVLHGYFSPLMTTVFRGIERFLGRFASDRIIVISRQQFDELALHYRVADPSVFRIVPLGIDVNAFKPRSADMGEGGANIRIGLVGRLTAIKDPFLFLEAGRIVMKEEPRARLVFIGDGEMRAELERAAGAEAEFLGNRNDIENLMPTLDILAISSKNEGTPMSVIEAFAAGVVVVGTGAGGVVDLLAEERGLLSEIGDAGALAANILRFIREPELARQVRRKALDFVRREYALDRMMFDMEKVYRELK